MVYCQGICTASKHVGVDDSNFPKTIASDLSLTATTLTGLGTEEWVLKIIDEKGDRQRAVPIFDAVLGFWKNFISNNKVDD